MIKAIMNGCNGRMGHVIVDIAGTDNDIEIVAGVDNFGENNYSFPTFRSLAEVDVECDVVIDFSNASGVDELLDTCVSNGSTGTPVVGSKEETSEIYIIKVLSSSIICIVNSSQRNCLGNWLLPTSSECC